LKLLGLAEYGKRGVVRVFEKAAAELPHSKGEKAACVFSSAESL